MSAAPQPTPVLRRHPDIYFADGDIVLSAPSHKTVNSVILFRVDTLMLKRHSPIFNDMLQFRPGTTSDEEYDGVPRVHLTDRAEDLATLLSAMYNPA